MTEKLVDHICTEHIDIWCHFLRDHSQRGDIVINHVSTHKQIADIFTKPLDEKQFCEPRSELNVFDSRNID
jgi:aminopeptidase-like protein